MAQLGRRIGQGRRTNVGAHFRPGRYCGRGYCRDGPTRRQRSRYQTWRRLGRIQAPSKLSAKARCHRDERPEVRTQWRNVKPEIRSVCAERRRWPAMAATGVGEICRTTLAHRLGTSRRNHTPSMGNLSSNFRWEQSYDGHGKSGAG